MCVLAGRRRVAGFRFSFAGLANPNVRFLSMLYPSRLLETLKNGSWCGMYARHLDFVDLLVLPVSDHLLFFVFSILLFFPPELHGSSVPVVATAVHVQRRVSQTPPRKAVRDPNSRRSVPLRSGFFESTPRTGRKRWKPGQKPCGSDTPATSCSTTRPTSRPRSRG